MDIEKINYNEVLISGKINNIKHFNNYIAFGLTCNTFAKIKSNCFISFHVYEDLYNIYKDLFYKNTNKPEDVIDGRKGPYIRYDEDGVMVWNGKRCEADPFSEDDPEYLELVEMLKEYE